MKDGTILAQELTQELKQELRAPLTVISGYLETLYDSHEEWQEPFGRMIQQSVKIDKMLNDLAYLVELETSELDVKDTELFDIKPLIYMALEEQQLCYPGKHFSHSFSADTSIRGNSDELYTGLTKLLENSGENTEDDGSVNITWHEWRGNRVLSVKDNGAGIEQQHLDQVTQRFYRTDLNAEGVGLGLCIAKRAFERHSANLAISSELGSGTVVDCIFNSA